MKRRLAVVYSRASLGIQAPLVIVEAHLANGLPGFSIVGLPEAAVKESKERVKSALINSQFEFPAKKIIINLAPADLPKEGGRFDLPIALGILAANECFPGVNFDEYEFAGELALSGELRAIPGALTMALGTRMDRRLLVLPAANAEEASLPKDNQVYGANHLLEVVSHLKKEHRLALHVNTSRLEVQTHSQDLSEVAGQHYAKRALEIAASGNHSLLMIGPPGTGKTMLASRLASILPPLTTDEALEVAALHSLSGKKENPPLAWGQRPFRNPHHTASSVALVGGGGKPKPGEISLAHHGVLFLDELPEFSRSVLEVLREPLESGHILISRAARHAEFPARFQLIAAMNPCPCGYLNDSKGKCRCTSEQVQRYRARISGPLFDRIDMHIEVARLSTQHLLDQKKTTEETSLVIRERVVKARERQLDRANIANGQLSNAELQRDCILDKETRQFLSKVMDQWELSARSYHRILRLSRTIADLADRDVIEKEHLLEALSFRKLDKDLG